MKRCLGWVALILLLAAVPAVAQGAACTGACWHYGEWSCGFTAYQEGGICQIVQDSQGNPAVCILYSCPGGGGWLPENQGRAAPQELFPWDGIVESQAADSTVTATVVPPRS